MFAGHCCFGQVQSHLLHTTFQQQFLLWRIFCVLSHVLDARAIYIWWIVKKKRINQTFERSDLGNGWGVVCYPLLHQKYHLQNLQVAVGASCLSLTMLLAVPMQVDKLCIIQVHSYRSPGLQHMVSKHRLAITCLKHFYLLTFYTHFLINSPKDVV